MFMERLGRDSVARGDGLPDMIKHGMGSLHAHPLHPPNRISVSNVWDAVIV